MRDKEGCASNKKIRLNAVDLTSDLLTHGWNVYEGNKDQIRRYLDKNGGGYSVGDKKNIMIIAVTFFFCKKF